MGKRWAAWAAAMIDRSRKDEHQEIRYNWRCCQLRDSPRVGKEVPMLAVLFIGIAGGLALALIAEIVKAAKDARRVNKLVKQLPAVYERYIDAERRARNRRKKGKDATEAEDERRKALSEYSDIVTDHGITYETRRKLVEQYPISGFILWS